MSDLDAWRQKRLAEMQAGRTEPQESQENLTEKIHQLEAAVKPYFTKEALSRYGAIKTAYPKRAVRVTLVIWEMIQQGKLKQVSDETLKNILITLTPKKKDFTIKR